MSVTFFDDDGDFRDAGELCRAQAPLARDQLITVAVHRRDDEGLYQALLADGVGKLS